MTPIELLPLLLCLLRNLDHKNEGESHTQHEDNYSPLSNNAELVIHQILEDIEAEEEDLFAFFEAVHEPVSAQEPIVGNGKV